MTREAYLSHSVMDSCGACLWSRVLPMIMREVPVELQIGMCQIAPGQWVRKLKTKGVKQT